MPLNDCKLVKAFQLNFHKQQLIYAKEKKCWLRKDYRRQEEEHAAIQFFFFPCVCMCVCIYNKLEKKSCVKKL